MQAFDTIYPSSHDTHRALSRLTANLQNYQ